jgi:hypothetical protein
MRLRRPANIRELQSVLKQATIVHTRQRWTIVARVEFDRQLKLEVQGSLAYRKLDVNPRKHLLTLR